MVIQLKVFEQTLSIIDTKSVPRKGSKDYLVLQFTFSSDWKDLKKLCYLQSNEVSQPIEVVDGLVEVPEWFTEQDSFNITLLGTNGGQEVPTNVVYLHLQKSNTLWEKDAPEPQPSWLAKVIDMNNHPPIPGDNGCWRLWNTDSGAYVDSELPLPDMPVGPSGGSVPKPLTFDYMPEGYPTKSVQTTTLIEEQEVAFALSGNGVYVAEIANAFEIVDGQTYTVNWDGTEYECVGVVIESMTALGNLSITGKGSDTGEPFLYGYNTEHHAGMFGTLDTSASHTISVKTTVKTVTPMAFDYMPEGYPTKSVQTTTLMEEQQVAFTLIRGVYTAQITNAFEVVEGQTYKVNWDGTEYECVGAAYVRGAYVIGNLAIIAPETDTGEPFIYFYAADKDEVLGQFGAIDTAESHTISVKTTAEIVTPMAFDYMPDGYPTKSVKNITLMKEQQVAFTLGEENEYIAPVTNAFKIVDGQTYTVNWDGTEYECVGAMHTFGNLSLAGMGDDTGEPFVYGYDPRHAAGTFLTLDTAANHTISVKTTAEIITPIDEKYLPENIATKSDVENVQITAENAQTTANNAQTTANNAQTTANSAQSTANNAKTTAENAQSTANNAKTTAENAQSTANAAKSKAESIKPNWNENNSSKPRYIANRPFYHDIITAEIPSGKSKTPSAKFPIDRTELYWSGDVTNLTGLLRIDENKIYILNGTLEKFTPVEFRTGTNSYSYGYALGNPHLIKANESSAKDNHGGELPDTGGDWVYYNIPNKSSFVTISKTNGWYGTFKEFLSEDLKLLDEKFIPASIQRTGGEVFLHSSTPNSTKKFKITVDDNGTISATEVT